MRRNTPFILLAVGVTLSVMVPIACDSGSPADTAAAAPAAPAGDGITNPDAAEWFAQAETQLQEAIEAGIPSEAAVALRKQALEVVANWGNHTDPLESLQGAREILDAAAQRALDHGASAERVAAFHAKITARLDALEHDLLATSQGDGR